MAELYSRVTHIANGAGATTLGGGGAVAIGTFIVANTTGSAVTITCTNAAASANVLIVAASANGTTEVTPCALFDTGVIISEPASGVTVTVAWRPFV